MGQVSILHFSDLHFLLDYGKDKGAQTMHQRSGKDFTQNMADMINEIKNNYSFIDFGIVTGDITTDGTAEDYAAIKTMLDTIHFPIYFCLGNHDSRKVFRNVFEGMAQPDDSPYYYAATDSKTGLEIIALDSSYTKEHAGDLTPAQFHWLEGRLKNPSAKGRILILHHPPALPVQFQGFGLSDSCLEKLSQIIYQSDIELILSGHIHMNLYSTVAGIPSYTAGSIAFGIDTLKDKLVTVNNAAYNMYVKQTGNSPYFAMPHSLTFDLNRITF